MRHAYREEFVDQIDKGLPLTVTDPEMTRFMMSLDQAVDLVLYAFEHGDPGDLFVQKAPAATIGTLAEEVKSVLQVDNEVNVSIFAFARMFVV